MISQEKIKTSARQDAFGSVALWQLMTFLFLICFIWANELLDLPNYLFGAEASPFNISRGLLLTMAIVATAVVAVGHTYEQQRSIVKNLVMTCAYCHRVETGQNSWEHVEEYFIKHYPVDLGRGACPECQKMLEAVQERQKTPQPIPEATA
ncbi:MAG: hypothetical protein HY343_12485 [Lentisphaerae bacterium]|nr:hypothetical protein [Lentisphaerota bacterium]